MIFKESMLILFYYLIIIELIKIEKGQLNYAIYVMPRRRRKLIDGQRKMEKLINN